MSRCISIDFQEKKRSFLAGAGFSLALFSWAALGVDGAGAQGLGVDHALEYGACLELTGSDPEQALESARVWSEAAGGDAAEHCAALALVSLNRYEEAAEKLEILADNLRPEMLHLRADVLAQAGQAWYIAGELEKAVTIQTKAIALAPEDLELRIDRGLTLAADGQYWSAVDDLNEANTLDPTRADVLIYRASAYRYLETYDLAFEDIEAALTLRPDSAEALLERGNIFRLIGQEEAARDDWVRVTTLAPRSPAADAAQANLTMLGVNPKIDSSEETGAGESKEDTPASNEAGDSK